MATPSLRWNSPRCERRNRSGRTSGSRHVLLDFFEDSLVIRRDFRIFCDPLVPDDPVGIQHEDGSLRHPVEAEPAEALVEHPVRGADRLVPIAQQRIKLRRFCSLKTRWLWWLSVLIPNTFAPHFCRSPIESRI